MEVDPKVAATGGGMIAAAFGWLLNRVYRALGHRIENAKQIAENAIALAGQCEDRRRTDVIDIHQKLDDHIQRDIEMHNAVLGAMREQTQALGDIHASLEHALGERPTRPEVVKLIELHQKARR